ncbi:NAD(P)/FAD-dependent oxidoreductase [Mycobacterium sp. CVI_P3]|uniref:Pyridine nucleotide-disulfide oxidoreductase domain-containing protein 2 n=1 Tax=Mycobacterium pinniadriaticum TaxID=2994102 RepID=A0ABT3SDW0_9MYCO|nr:NAD(P)/FAD-dependent oxidoreductase [Mycobacterium pinniadriaticum]MCX2930681.1 NAD(P)/FAD-dependent oxidoreductase [Mycobacterium pinniadriaticum]MCX2937105.1 NAD(P)/FAD-dependent oxidoreductase [Mycobacterium pinniadriaticum]
MHSVEGARQHDVVIVGGGHNGLVTGCYLARAGLRVLVLEQRSWLGGMAASQPFVEGAPEHILSPGAWENVYFRAGGVGRDLELERYGHRDLDSAGWAWLGGAGESLVVQADLGKTIADIRRFSVKDANTYAELTEAAIKILEIQDQYGLSNPTRLSRGTIQAVLRAVAGGRRVRSLLASALTTTAADGIDGLFESDAVRGIFAGTGSILAPLTVDGSAIAVLAPSMIHHQGAVRPVGGMGGLVAALERCLLAHGGQVRLDSEVVAIRMGGRGGSVELTDGSVIRAGRAVIAACPAQRVPDLVGDGFPADIAARIRKAPANSTGLGTFTVNVALAGRLELPHHQPHRADGIDLRRPALYAGSLEDVVAAGEQSARGEVPDQAVFCLGILSAIDPSQAPAGQDVAQLYGPAPVDPVGGWDKWRDEAQRRLVEKVEQFTPEFSALTIGPFVETAQDIAVRTGAVNGCIYHIDNVPTRLGPMRPAAGTGGYRTPVDGLYLGSASVHPGGGVSGLPGRHCAEVVLKDLGYRSRKSAAR